MIKMLSSEGCEVEKKTRPGEVDEARRRRCKVEIKGIDSTRTLIYNWKKRVSVGGNDRWAECIVRMTGIIIVKKEVSVGDFHPKRRIRKAAAQSGREEKASGGRTHKTLLTMGNSCRKANQTGAQWKRGPERREKRNEGSD